MPKLDDPPVAPELVEVDEVEEVDVEPGSPDDEAEDALDEDAELAEELLVEDETLPLLDEVELTLPEDVLLLDPPVELVDVELMPPVELLLLDPPDPPDALLVLVLPPLDVDEMTTLPPPALPPKNPPKKPPPPKPPLPPITTGGALAPGPA